MSDTDGLYLGEFSLASSSVFPQDFKKFKAKLREAGYAVVEAGEAEPGTYEIYELAPYLIGE